MFDSEFRCADASAFAGLSPRRVKLPADGPFALFYTYFGVFQRNGANGELVVPAVNQLIMPRARMLREHRGESCSARVHALESPCSLQVGLSFTMGNTQPDTA